MSDFDPGYCLYGIEAPASIASIPHQGKNPKKDLWRQFRDRRGVVLLSIQLRAYFFVFWRTIPGGAIER